MSDVSSVDCFFRNRGEVLLSRADGSTDRWSGLTRPADDDPDAAAATVAETVADGDATLVRTGRPVVGEDGRRIKPYLFDCPRRSVTVPDDVGEAEWLAPTVLLDDPDDPDWIAYERIAPSVGSVAADAEHGSAYISIRTLEVLRDRAALVDRSDADPADAWDELSDLARRLRTARPDMAALANRVNRAMFEAEGSPGSVERTAIAGIERAAAADDRAADEAVKLVEDATVFTLSWSGTVLVALRRGEPDRVLVAESRPAREGVDLAETLADSVPVTLATDAAIAYLLTEREVDLVLVGADAVLPDGRVVNKTGTRTAAIVADHEDVPVCAVTASDKITADPSVSLESGDRSAVYDGDAAIDVVNPTFDVTPADRVDGIATDRGTLSTDEVADVAAEHRRTAGWR